MSTVALGMIIKDEYEAVTATIHYAIPHFDQIVLTVSDKLTANNLKKEFSTYSSVEVIWREWNNEFDAARNANMAKLKTDYMFWIDADDSFNFTKIKELVKKADDENIDAIFLPYNYARDENGKCIVRHWRERLVRLSVPFEWRGRVHESLISDTPYSSSQVNIEVLHHSNSAEKSLARNHDILVKAVAETEDPRYVHYLGMSYFTMGEYEDAIDTFADYLLVGGNDEDIYRSLNLMAESAWHLKDISLAMEYAFKATSVIPEYPMAFWLLAQFESEQGNQHEAIEWLKVSETKPDPQTLAVWDPSSRDRARLLKATCLFEAGQHNAALGALKTVQDTSLANDVYDDFLNEADLETLIAFLPSARKFFKSDEDLWGALAKDVKYDIRIKSLKNKVVTPQKWGDNSVVIFCGQGYEEWGPQTMNKGMGGSEEAVVYLSREFAKLGWEVTVFAEADLVDQEGECSVKWQPWKEMDTRDEFNVFISWRSPQYAQKVMAKVKIVDLHDIVPKEVVKDIDATFFVKSQYQRNLYDHLPDSKFVVVGNGLKKEQF